MNFSIVVPSYNQGEYIEATLKSILDLQSGYPVEVMVHDGGSSDCTVNILKQYDGRLHWTSASDFGQTDAINKGLRQARGDIVAYLNSDDVYLPGTFSAVAEHFAAHPDCDLVYGDAWHLHANGTIMDAYPTAPWNYDQLFNCCFLCQPAVFWRRDLHERMGYFDERLDLSMDYEFWLRIGRMANVYYMSGKFLAGSRLHADTKTLRQRLPVHREILLVVRRHARRPSDCYTWLRHLAALTALDQGFPSSEIASEQKLHALAFGRNLLGLAEEYRISLNDEILNEIETHAGLGFRL